MTLFKLLIPFLMLSIALLKDFLPTSMRGNKWIRPTMISFLVLVAIVNAVIVINDDNRNAKADLREEKSRKAIDSLVTLSNNTSIELKEQKELVSKINEKLEPFIRIAQTKYPKSSLDEALSKIQNSLEDIKETTKPIVLGYLSATARKVVTGVECEIILKPSKEGFIGELKYRATIKGFSDARILSFSPSISCAGVEETIASDGKWATLSFTPFSSGNPVIKIILSKQATLVISGNRGLESFSVDVQ
jgi:hypothetical protein